MTITEKATAPPGLEVKTGVSNVLASDDEQGIVEALVSVTGVVDDQNDIILPGAYTKTLAKRRAKGARFHAWDRPVARTKEIEEWLPGDKRLPKKTALGEPWPAEAGALYVKMQYNLGTTAGRDAYSDAKFFHESGDGQWSIGYAVPKGAASRNKVGQRELKEVDLYEYSDVLHGAAPLTLTLSAKNATPGTVPDVDDQEVVEDVPEVDEKPPPLRAQLPPAGFVIEPFVAPAPAEEVKAIGQLAGSFEEIRELVQAPLNDLLGEAGSAWVSVVGTWSDRVVATRYTEDATTESYEVPYTLSDAGALELGTPVRVLLRMAAEPAPDDTDDAADEAAGKSLARLVDSTASTTALAFTGVKGGRVLSKPNAARVREAFTRLREVLAAAGVGDESAPPTETGEAGGKAADSGFITLDRKELDDVLAGLDAVA